MALDSDGADDVIVVGAGLAGLAAALHLQRAGRRTRVLEALPRAGGLCGTVERDGLEFSIACNDFGQGLARRCREFGSAIGFRPVRSCFVVATDRGERRYWLPVGPRSAGSWLRRIPEIARLYRALRSTALHPATMLGEGLDRIGASRELRALVGVLGYPLGAPPSQLSLESLRAEMSPALGYRSHRSRVPEGGPQRLADALVARLRELGASVELGTPVREVGREGSGFVSRTPHGDRRAQQVVTSVPPARATPQGALPGLEISTIRLWLRADAPIPRGLHTLAWIPEDADGWLGALHRGEWPKRFGFHFHPCETPVRDGRLAANVMFFQPRDGGEDRSPARVGPLLEALDRLVPGIGRAIEAHELVTPTALRSQCGVSSRVVPYVMPAGSVKRDVYDEATGLFHVGNAVGPPGDHAGGAWLSGVWAAEQLLSGRRSAATATIPRRAVATTGSDRP